MQLCCLLINVFMQLRRKPLTASEFLAPLSKIDPIYAEEEEQFKVYTHLINTVLCNHKKRGRTRELCNLVGYSGTSDNGHSEE